MIWAVLQGNQTHHGPIKGEEIALRHLCLRERRIVPRFRRPSPELENQSPYSQYLRYPYRLVPLEECCAHLPGTLALLFNLNLSCLRCSLAATMLCTVQSTSGAGCANASAQMMSHSGSPKAKCAKRDMVSGRDVLGNPSRIHVMQRCARTNTV